MRKSLILVVVLVFIALALYATQVNDPPKESDIAETVSVQPITHATAVLTWDGRVIYIDPTGGAEAFADRPAPTLVLVTDTHGDHFSIETLEAVVGNAPIIVPKAVYDELPAQLAELAVVLPNGALVTQRGFSIKAIPMYNLPESEDAYHVKGHGNGYVLERGDTRVYIAGDTSGTPEMRKLTNIDVAFVPMNLPYTMDVDEAADAVLDFAPAHVYPYHYRGQDGLHDVERFKELVNAGNPDIEVVLLDWYPEI